MLDEEGSIETMDGEKMPRIIQGITLESKGVPAKGEETIEQSSILIGAIKVKSDVEKGASIPVLAAESEGCNTGVEVPTIASSRGTVADRIILATPFSHTTTQDRGHADTSPW